MVMGPGGKVCQTQIIDAYGTVPDMLIVLDRSDSMMLFNRWQPSKQAVKQITTEFEGLLAFGLSYFPGESAGVVDPVAALLGGPAPMCAGGEKLDVPMMLRNAGAIGQSLDRTPTRGLTPTGAALRAALGVLGDRTLQLDTAVKPGYVLLVTDGDPSCDPALALSGAIDPAQQEEARVAVKALKDKGIPTYVIGYQIDATRQAIMNEMATLGGTMKYHPAESGEQIIAAFRQITKDVIKCTFDLRPSQGQQMIDPRFVRVQIDGKSVPLNGEHGWVIQGNTITLQGGACSTLKDGRGHTLNAQVECTEVVLQ
ncbi:MAG TPA: vWA domain-containing protein [Polyangiales bacterium]